MIKGNIINNLLHKFFETLKLPKLIPESIENLHGSKSTREFEAVIKAFPKPKRKTSEVNYIEHLREKWYQSYIKCFRKVWRREYFTIHFMEATLILLSTPKTL